MGGTVDVWVKILFVDQCIVVNSNSLVCSMYFLNCVKYYRLLSDKGTTYV